MKLVKVLNKLVIIVFIFSAASLARALTLSMPNDLVLDIFPASPQAETTFTASAKSYVFDSARARFTWFLNGTQIASGVGLIEETLIAPKLGSTINIKVNANTADGNFYSASNSITVSDIDFIVSPETYTPPLYRGSALATPGSIVDVFAVPHLFSGGAKLNPKNLIYEWSLDGKPVLDQSGGGKNKLAVLLADVKNGSHVVSLRASSQSNNVSDKKTTRIETRDPEILFYKSNSVIGKNPLASSIFSVNPGSSFSITAEPYFMALDSLAKAKFNWEANGIAFAKDATNPRILDLTAPQDAAAETSFSLSIIDTKTLFQRVGGILQVIISK